jgi:hypothetical protein
MVGLERCPLGVMRGFRRCEGSRCRTGLGWGLELECIVFGRGFRESRQMEIGCVVRDDMAEMAVRPKSCSKDCLVRSVTKSIAGRPWLALLFVTRAVPPTSRNVRTTMATVACFPCHTRSC